MPYDVISFGLTFALDFALELVLPPVTRVLAATESTWATNFLKPTIENPSDQ